MAQKYGLDRPDMSFADLARHALEVIAVRRLSEIVCGPITTGGFGEAGMNVLLFNHAIELLELEGRPMFNQISYEFRLAQLDTAWKKEGNGDYCHPILTDFYEPIFRSRRLHRAWFLPGWETSVGATWEHEILSELRCSIMYLRKDWIYNLDVRSL